MSTSLVLEQLAVGIALQLLGLLVAMYLFRWRKEKEKTDELPSDFMERFRDLEERVGDFRERMTRMETKLNGAAWKPGGISGRE